MCIGAMSFPNEDATIPGVTPARSAMTLAGEDPEQSSLNVSISSPASVAAPGDPRAGAAGGGDPLLNRGRGTGGRTTDPTDPRIPGGGGPTDPTDPTDGRDGDPTDPIGPGGGRGGRGGGRIVDDGSGGQDDDPTIDDELDPQIDDDIDDPTEPTRSASRMLSPLILAVQAPRKINRRGRNALFIPQGSRGGRGPHRIELPINPRR